MKPIALVLILMPGLNFCRAQQRATPLNYHMIVHAADLSENIMKNISSGNDELQIMVYLDKHSEQYPILLTDTSLQADSSHKNFIIPFTVQASDSLNSLVIVLVEKDTRNSANQTEAVFRVNLPFIEKATSLSALEPYLGDDDLLGIKRASIRELLNTSNPLRFIIQGMDKTDKYLYEFAFVPAG